MLTLSNAGWAQLAYQLARLASLRDYHAAIDSIWVTTLSLDHPIGVVPVTRKLSWIPLLITERVPPSWQKSTPMGLRLPNRSPTRVAAPNCDSHITVRHILFGTSLFGCANRKRPLCTPR